MRHISRDRRHTARRSREATRRALTTRDLRAFELRAYAVMGTIILIATVVALLLT